MKLSSHQRIKATERYREDFRNLMEQHIFIERMRYRQLRKSPEYDLRVALEFMNVIYGIKR